MKRASSTFTTVLIVFTLLVPVAAFAARAGNSGKGQSQVTHGRKAAGSSGKSAAQESKKPLAAGKPARAGHEKAAKIKRVKKAKKAKRAATAATVGAAVTTGSDTATETAGASEENSATEGSPATETAGPDVSNAFARITANLEKSLAKIAAGKKTQLPPGLVRVWQKFAGWLGVDPANMPGTPTTAPGGSVDETGSVTATTTPEPTATIEPSPTVDASATPTL